MTVSIYSFQSELNYVSRVPLCPMCLCALRVCVLPCISTVSAFIFLMYLTRLHFLTCTTSFSYVSCVSWFFCVPSFFLCALHALTFLHALCTFIFLRAFILTVLNFLDYMLSWVYCHYAFEGIAWVQDFFSRGYFVGLKFFLVSISWVLNFFPWIFRGFKVFSWALVGPKFFLLGVRGSKIFLVSIRGSEVFSREYFLGPIFFF